MKHVHSEFWLDEFDDFDSTVEVDENIPALTEAEMKEARLLFPKMTVGIPENHSWQVSQVRT